MRISSAVFPARPMPSRCEPVACVVNSVEHAGEVREGGDWRGRAAGCGGEMHPGDQAPTDVLMEVAVIERRRRLDGMDQLAVVDGAMSARAGRRVGRESELAEQLDERDGGHLKPLG